MKLVALDPALTNTGVATWDDGEVEAHTIRTPAKLRGGERLDWLHGKLKEAVSGASAVVAEGYSYNSRGSSITLGELGGVIRLLLFREGISLYTVPPASVKRLATGRGNASKKDVLASARLQLGYAGTSDHEADAVWIMTFALIKEGVISVDKLTPKQQAAIDAVSWEPK